VISSAINAFRFKKQMSNYSESWVVYEEAVRLEKFGPPPLPEKMVTETEHPNWESDDSKEDSESELFTMPGQVMDLSDRYADAVMARKQQEQEEEEERRRLLRLGPTGLRYPPLILDPQKLPRKLAPIHSPDSPLSRTMPPSRRLTQNGQWISLPPLIPREPNAFSPAAEMEGSDGTDMPPLIARSAFPPSLNRSNAFRPEAETNHSDRAGLPSLNAGPAFIRSQNRSNAFRPGAETEHSGGTGLSPLIAASAFSRSPGETSPSSFSPTIEEAGETSKPQFLQSKSRGLRFPPKDRALESTADYASSSSSDSDQDDDMNKLLVMKSKSRGLRFPPSGRAIESTASPAAVSSRPEIEQEQGARLNGSRDSKSKHKWLGLPFPSKFPVRAVASLKKDAIDAKESSSPSQNSDEGLDEKSRQ